MPFQKGQSGNPFGSKTKRQWIKEKKRFEEAKKTWDKLIELRDGMILERKEFGKDENGVPIMVDVVPSIKDYIDCCKEIMNRAIGRPAQQINIAPTDGKPFAWNLVLQTPEQPKEIELKPEEGTFYFPTDGENGEVKH